VLRGLPTTRHVLTRALLRPRGPRAKTTQVWAIGTGVRASLEQVQEARRGARSFPAPRRAQLLTKSACRGCL
jgi:hypothetical protein